jgi:hypothetical protein
MLTKDQHCICLRRLWVSQLPLVSANGKEDVEFNQGFVQSFWEDYFMIFK